VSGTISVNCKSKLLPGVASESADAAHHDAAHHVDSMLAVVHPSPAAQIAVVGRQTSALLLAFKRRGFAFVRNIRPGTPAIDGEAVDVVWIANARNEVELDDALRAARSYAADRTRVVVEIGALRQAGVAIIARRAVRFGFCVLFADRAARHTILATMPLQAMAA
jgi:hypothetical protein